MRRTTIVPALAAAALCTLATRQTASAQAMSGASPITKAVAVIHGTKGNDKVHGEVTFTKAEGGVKVEGTIRGLSQGEHGFHVHEFGDVSSDEAMSAGPHFNPDKMDHGAPKGGKRHVGDLGNIKADDKGVAKISLTDPMLSFSGPHSIIGRGLIVHEKADDLKSQPAGDAGKRIGAAVIGVAKGE